MSIGKSRLAVTVTVTAILAASVAACGQAAAPGGGTSHPSMAPSSAAPSGGMGTPAPSAAATAGPDRHAAPPRASAADQLAGFFAAAAAADSRLKHAAVLVNAGIGTTSLDFSPAALTAVETLDTSAVAHAVPGGMPAELLRRVLLAYSDLVSRTLAFRRVQESKYWGYPIAIGSQQGKDIYGCLRNGTQAAARYAGDMAAVRALAGRTPPLTPPAPDSRAAAELALRVYVIQHRNSGCEECGGFVFTALSRVIWQPKDEPEIGESDGTVDGIRFRVTYHAGRGWDVMVWAC